MQVFWMLMFIAPFGVMCPGPIGEFFRMFKAVVGTALLAMVAMLGWFIGCVYFAGACWLGGNVLACESGHSLFVFPTLPLQAFAGPVLTHDEYQAKWAQDDAARHYRDILTADQRARYDDEQRLVSYNKRNNTHYVLDANGRVVTAPARSLLDNYYHGSGR